ncbi:hypothetical protein C8R47DRAFT_1167575, partial [Mycena vitilis]
VRLVLGGAVRVLLGLLERPVLDAGDVGAAGDFPLLARDDSLDHILALRIIVLHSGRGSSRLGLFLLLPIVFALALHPRPPALHLPQQLLPETLTHRVRRAALPARRPARCVIAHLIEIKAHAVDRLLEHQVLLILLVELRVRLLRHGKLLLEVRDAVLVPLVLLGVPCELDLREPRRLAQRADGLFAVAQVVAVLFRARALVEVLPLQAVVRCFGRLELLGELSHLGLERTDLSVVLSLRGPQLFLLSLRRTELVARLLQLDLQVLEFGLLLGRLALHRALRILQLAREVVVDALQRLDAFMRHHARGARRGGAVHDHVRAVPVVAVRVAVAAARHRERGQALAEGVVKVLRRRGRVR